jgi:hypothetical protein
MGKTKSQPGEHAVRLIEYVLPGGWKVLAGRTDADNEHLSLRVARPDDWWFHVRGMPGSHVVLQGPPGEDPDRRILKRAAASRRGGGLVHAGPLCHQGPRHENGHRADSQGDCIQGPTDAWRTTDNAGIVKSSVAPAVRIPLTESLTGVMK